MSLKYAFNVEHLKIQTVLENFSQKNVGKHAMNVKKVHCRKAGKYRKIDRSKIIIIIPS